MRESGKSGDQRRRSYFLGHWRGRSKIWAGASIFMMVLGVSQIGGLFVGQGISQLNTGVALAGDQAELGGYKLTLMEDGRQIELSGDITIGATEEMERLLDASPAVRTVRLDSHGGHVDEARALRDMLRRRGLDTHTATQCFAACTVAFLGGRERVVEPGARLGFHAFVFPGMTEAEFSATNWDLIEETVLIGVDRNFAEIAYTYPHNSMWFPSTDAMIEARFVTDIDKARFTKSGNSDEHSREAVAATTRRLPVYAILARLEPEWFAETVDSYHAGLVAGLTEEELVSRTQSSVGQIMFKYLPRASDEALLAFGGLAADLLAALAAEDKLACYHYMFPQEGQMVDISRYFDDELEAKAFRVSEMVILSGAVGTAVEFDPERFTELYVKLFMAVALEGENNALQTFVAAAEDPSAVSKADKCDLSVLIYQKLLTFPNDEAVYLMRGMFAAEA